MGAVKEDADHSLIETGSEPEFVIYDLPRWEDAGDGLVRIFVSSKHGRTTRMEYSFVCSPERFAYLCRKGLMFAAEAHNLLEFQEALREH